MSTNQQSPQFRYPLAQSIFDGRLRREGIDTWDDLAMVVATDVCGGILTKPRVREIAKMISNMEFIPGGRYLAYAGLPLKYFQNCYAFRSMEDTREDWASLYHKGASALMTGGGIGNDYSVYRPQGALLKRTRGVASGPLPLMEAVNGVGRASVQGGGRRAAIYASLAREHGDVRDFLVMKNWHDIVLPGTGKTLAEIKALDYDFPCPMDHTNISVNYSDEWKSLPDPSQDEVFMLNCKQALQTGEPGFSFNFGAQAGFTGRNACTEFITDQDGDACNLGSVNMSRIESLQRFGEVCELASMFLYCGTMRAKVPTEEIGIIRDANRRIGLGLMGVHEWLIRRGYEYGMNDQLRVWMQKYKNKSEIGANHIADVNSLPRPKAYRALAPCGTIGIYAGTTTGLEPIFGVAYKRRYREGMLHKFQYCVDATAKTIAQEFDINPDTLESSLTLAKDFERRIKFQADIQDYLDMGISSTLNMPAWNSEHNNEATVKHFATVLAKYAPRLRGLTCYPDGARGGQPLEPCSYEEAIKHEGQHFKEEVVDVCTLNGGGSCND